MKKFSQAFIGGTLVLLLIPIVTFAFEYRVGETPMVPVGETVSGDLYVVGGSPLSAGSVEGDLFITGGTVLISGTTGGDVAAGGGSVTVIGDIADDLRAGGGNITVQGTVGGDVVIGGGQVSINGSGIGGDVVVGGGVISLSAPVGGDLLIGGGSVTINAAITGNVTVYAESVTLGSEANIAGDFSYHAPQQATVAGGATVAGETTFTEVQGPRDGDKRALVGGIVAAMSVWFFVKFLMVLTGALIIGLVFVKYSREVIRVSSEKPFNEGLRGFLFIVALPVASGIALATIIGIPLGVIGFLIFALSLVFVPLVTPIVLGAFIHKWVWKPVAYEVSAWTILLGTVVYVLLGLVPVLGWLVKFCIFVVVLGAVLSIRWRLTKEWVVQS